MAIRGKEELKINLMFGLKNKEMLVLLPERGGLREGRCGLRLPTFFLPFRVIPSGCREDWPKEVASEAYALVTGFLM